MYLFSQILSGYNAWSKRLNPAENEDGNIGRKFEENSQIVAFLFSDVKQIKLSSK